MRGLSSLQMYSQRDIYCTKTKILSQSLPFIWPVEIFNATLGLFSLFFCQRQITSISILYIVSGLRFCIV